MKKNSGICVSSSLLPKINEDLEATLEVPKQLNRKYEQALDKIIREGMDPTESFKDKKAVFSKYRG